MDNKESVITQVTRQKHPGRVAHGKKLAALMKQRKEALMTEVKPEVEAEVNPEVGLRTDQVSLSTCQVPTSWYGGGVVILVLGGIAFYLYFQKKSTPAEAVAVKNDDIFRMN